MARERRELDAALTDALRLPDDRLRSRLEELAIRHRNVFPESVPRWGPPAWRRDRVRFRPLLLVHASDSWGAWKGQERALQAWLSELEGAGDDELFRALYPVSVGAVGADERSARWRRDLLASWTAPGAQRARVLSRFDIPGFTLDEACALALWEADPARARPFVLRHLPFPGWWWLGTRAPEPWKDLSRRSEHRDPELHFALYRAQAPAQAWHRDVEALAERGGPDLDTELERRHVSRHDVPVAATYAAILDRAGLAAWPYVQRHLGSLRGNDAGAKALLDLCWARGWVWPWAAVTIRGGLLDHQVTRALEDRAVGTEEIRRRLAALGTAASSTTLPLSEAVALRVHRQFPDLLRGPLSGLLPRYGEPGALLSALLDAGDTDLLDRLASTFVLRLGGKDTVTGRLATHYAALPPAELARRGAEVLAGVPAHGVWAYDTLVRGNALARLLFERSDVWLDHGDTVRDLLESPSIHVQGLAFRLLGRDDPRARALAVRCLDLLVPTLLRALHSRTRRWAIAALQNAGLADADAARRIVPAARDALDLPDGRYPKEELVALLGRLLHRWPALRRAEEVPRVYRSSPAEAAR